LFKPAVSILAALAAASDVSINGVPGGKAGLDFAGALGADFFFAAGSDLFALAIFD
jgi:hypothetical protein